MNSEIWKDIPGYEGYYQISNFGNVRSLDRKVNHPKGGARTSLGQVIKPCANADGYLFVTLSKGNDVKPKRINRLVAESFIPNPDGLPAVNHRDENKLNNSVDNLEWCTIEYNNRYSLAKPVLQYDLDGKLIAKYEAISDAARITGINLSNIAQCCRGKRHTAGKYIWKYNFA